MPDSTGSAACWEAGDSGFLGEASALKQNDSGSERRTNHNNHDDKREGRKE